MKQGLKIVLLVLPQLFALMLKANASFAETGVSMAFENNFHQIQDQHYSNVTFIDQFKDLESEFEDEFIPNYTTKPAQGPRISTVQKANFYREFLQNQQALKLYILYSSLKLHC